MSIQQSNYIKLIAMITMFIDHLGVILFPSQIIFRIIGRITLPLIAYQLSIGYKNTKSLKKYLLRLLLFGLILQTTYVILIYSFNLGECPNYLNIFFTLFLGLTAIHFYNKKHYFVVLLICLTPVILRFMFGIYFDYDLYGITLILIINIKQSKSFQLTVLMILLGIIYDYFIKSDHYIQLYSVLAMCFILKPISLKFNIPKYAFYLFYPLHLAVIYLISIYIM